MLPSLFSVPPVSAKGQVGKICVPVILPPPCRAEVITSSFVLKYHFLPSPPFPHVKHLKLRRFLMRVGGKG